MEMYMHKGKHKHKGHKHCCGEMKETKFHKDKDYNFGIYKMDPSVNVLTKTKTNF